MGASEEKTLRILGIRGVPAQHGGFETFAERLALYLVERGWRVTVYCQEDGRGRVRTDRWQGVDRVIIPVSVGGSLGTVLFDLLSVVHACRTSELCLTLGYNTAVFNVLQRIRGAINIINMDGIEWKRKKWGAVAKAWFWFNERIGCLVGNHLVADHPGIQQHLETRVRGDKITVIAYGARAIHGLGRPQRTALGVMPGNFLTVVARPEPENSILEIVRGFSKRRRGVNLVVLGNYSESNQYHRQVKAAASSEVIFPGAIYDPDQMDALRLASLLYVHGHQVGGTNPSLVEALGAGNAIVAHDNKFNRWVAGDAAMYFDGSDGFSGLLDSLLSDPDAIAELSRQAILRYEAMFTWESILKSYEELLERFL